MFRSDDYDIWEKPAMRRKYNNVGTAASITGAARAKLLEAIHNAENPVYCDTDSLICTALNNTEIHSTRLGAWDLEKSFDEIIVAGKKLYSYRSVNESGQESGLKVRSKGAPVGALNWSSMLKLIAGETIPVTSKGVTLTKTGKQFYMVRNIRATAQTKERDFDAIGL